MHTFVTKKNKIRNLFKKIADIRTPVMHDYTKWEKKNYWLRLAGLNISSAGVAIDRNFQCLTGLEENIEIENFAAIGINAKLWNFNAIKIGKYCMIAADVTFTNGGHDRNSFEPNSGPLVIGNGCWIGNGARIVGPITVGDNAIIGAGAVVIRDVPPGSIVAGVPAKIIGMREIPLKVWHLGNDYFCPVTFTKIEGEI